MTNPNEPNQSVRDILRDTIGYIPPAEEEDFHPGFDKAQSACPYNKCEEGRGYLKYVKDGHTYTEWCDCYQDEVLKRKMKAAKIESKYLNASFDFDNSGVSSTLLQPIVEVGKPLVKKVKTKEVVETAEQYLQRVFKQRPVKKGVSFFAEEFTKITADYHSESPRVRSKNLLLIGEPGRSKTFLACAAGKEFLRQGKSVYFTTMLQLVADVMNPETDIRRIMKETDLVIVDEMGSEYHTDTQWALKQIKELFRIRYNSHLPVICTTNYYPNELAELYDPSLMSMFAGSYLFVLMQRDEDYRLLESEKNLEDFTFLDEE